MNITNKYGKYILINGKGKCYLAFNLIIANTIIEALMS
jgi:hypothetical protein